MSVATTVIAVSMSLRDSLVVFFIRAQPESPENIIRMSYPLAGAWRVSGCTLKTSTSASVRISECGPAFHPTDVETSTTHA